MGRSKSTNRTSSSANWWNENWGGLPRITTAMIAAFVLVSGTALGVIYLQKNAGNSTTAAEELIHTVPFPTPTPTPVENPVAKLDLGSNPRVLVIGDSWAAGEYATVRQGGFTFYAFEQLGWTRVDNQGVGGTGYITAGSNDNTYLQRILRIEVSKTKAPDLVVIEGSINDASGNISAIDTALRDVVNTINIRWPDAQVVVVGPFSPVWPASSSLGRIDDVLEATTKSLALPYISPLSSEWTTAENVETVVVEETGHPDDEGYEYFGTQFRKALEWNLAS